MNQVSGSKKHSLRQPVAGADGVWLQDSSVNLMVINAVFTVDAMGVETLRQLWTERVLKAGGGSRYPRFTQKVVREGGRFFWQEDEDFDLANHILAVEEPSIRTKEELQEYVGTLASQPLPEDRPRWQLLVVPNFGDGGTAVINRIHHCMGDGIALVAVLFSIMDTSAEGGGQVLPAVVDRGGKPPNRFLLALWAMLAGPLLLLERAFWRADKSPMHGPALSGDKQVAWTGAIDLDLVKKLKNHFEVTVNDLLVSCVAGAMRRYAAERGEPHLSRLKVSMPVNVRSRSEELKMDNKFAAVLLPLAVEMDDPHQRISETSRRLDALKKSIEPFFTYGAVKVMLKLLPALVSRLVLDFYANKCTCVLSNVPGPQQPVYLAGRRLRAMLFWVPQRARIGVGVSIITYDGGLRLGIFADTLLVPDAADMVRAFEAELDGLERHVAAHQDPTNGAG